MRRLPAHLRRWPARLGLVLFATLVGTALLADCLASDKPLFLRLDGSTYLLPCVFGAQKLQHHDSESLAAALGENDTMLTTPVGWGPNEQDKAERPLSPPSWRHLLGTDTSRRDVLARLVHGSRTAVLVGFLSVLIYASAGILLGVLAGTLGGVWDALVCRVMEALMSVPVFFLALALLGMVERRGLSTLILVIAVVSVARVTRLVRAEALRVKKLDYVAAAHVLGLSRSRIMLRYILPNAIAPAMVAAVFGIGSAIIAEASLSFLGFGLAADTASWGGTLREAMGNFHAWWLVVFPGFAVAATQAACSAAGEAMRDWLDPHEGERRVEQ